MTEMALRSRVAVLAILAALAATVAMLIDQDPAEAGLVIDDGACLGCTTPPPGGWCDLIGCAPPPPPPTTEPVDTAAPSAPVITSPAEGAASNVRSFVVSGIAEANSSVELFEGSVVGGTARANASGQWSINLTGVSDGSHSYFAKATDAAGNVSVASDPRTIVVDATAPTLGDFSPADATTEVLPAANVTATFSEAMDPSSITNETFVLSKVDPSTPVPARVSYDAVTHRATLDPDSSLEAGVAYKVRVGGGIGGVTDLAGNVFQGSYLWSFTTARPADMAAPKVQTVNPANGTTGVAPGASVAATFSEKMDPATLAVSTFKLFKVNADGTTKQLTNAPVALSADGLRATLDPFGSSTNRLALNTKYKAVVTTGAKDLAGNALDQNPSLPGDQPKSWTFAVRR